MNFWLRPDKVFDDRDLKSGLALKVENEGISEVAPVDQLPSDANVHNVSGVVTPGFVDLQVNGGGGVLLNKTPTAEGIGAIAQAHRQYGTTAIMPTVITDSPGVLTAAVKAAIEAKDQPGIVGLHIEGPHISLPRRGTHKAQFVRKMDQTTISCVAALCKAGVKTMVTLAPEAASPAEIQALVELGAVVSIGHTDASSEDVKQAFAAGATCATHLFNAMSQMQGRAPGAVGAVLNSELYSGIICDGIHVADEMVGLAIRARPVADRMFLVSDAMPTVGGPDHFDLYGKTIRLQEGRLVNSEGGLAGAHVTQAEGLKRLIANVRASPEAALRMAVSTPAAVISAKELAQIRKRPLNDLLILDADWDVTGTVAEHLERLAETSHG